MKFSRTSRTSATSSAKLLAGLIDHENAQLLVGSGTPPNLTGLLTTSGILTRARAADSSLDAIAKAKSDLRTGASFTKPDAIVIHPTNLLTIQTAKDTTGRYITNDPAATGPEQLFGMRVVATTKITLNTALKGNFAEAARLYVRQPPVVEIAPLGGGTVEFVSNQTLARCEERLALAVPRPTCAASYLADKHHGAQLRCPATRSQQEARPFLRLLALLVIPPAAGPPIALMGFIGPIGARRRCRGLFPHARPRHRSHT